MNHQLRRISGVIALGLVAILLNLAVTQVLVADSYRLNQDNTRLLLEEYGRERGPIVVAGQSIAKSVDTGETLQFERRYVAGELFAPATGFYSLVYGATGIERLYTNILSGRDDRLAVDRLLQLLAGQTPRGGVVTLTLNPEIQRVAYEQLAGRTGAVVVINATTGAILGLVSSPSYDPGLLSANNPTGVRKEYEKLLNDPTQPMLNRPLTNSLPPGSTFKLVVAAAALASGQYTADSVLPGPATIALPLSDKRIGNWQNGPCSPSGKVTLRRALEVSCNTAFAWLGMKLGAEALEAQAQAFGFNESFSIPLVAAASVFPSGIDEAQTAMSSIGQFDVRATALQMAMVVGAIANNGVVMQPYLVKNVMTTELDIIESTEPSQWSSAMSAEDASSLIDMMQSVVTNGTASSVRIEGLTVGAKTGTAESGTDKPAHAWFVATAADEKQTLAIAVVVDNGGGAAEVSGNAIAGPIAAAILKAALL